MFDPIHFYVFRTPLSLLVTIYILEFSMSDFSSLDGFRWFLTVILTVGCYLYPLLSIVFYYLFVEDS